MVMVWLCGRNGLRFLEDFNGQRCMVMLTDLHGAVGQVGDVDEAVSALRAARGLVERGYQTGAVVHVLELRHVQVLQQHMVS